MPMGHYENIQVQGPQISFTYVPQESQISLGSILGEDDSTIEETNFSIQESLRALIEDLYSEHSYISYGHSLQRGSYYRIRYSEYVSGVSEKDDGIVIYVKNVFENNFLPRRVSNPIEYFKNFKEDVCSKYSKVTLKSSRGYMMELKNDES